MFNKEKLSLITPTGTVTITRSKLKAVIIEASKEEGVREYVKTVVFRDTQGFNHYAFGDLERLKEFYGSDIVLK